MCQYNATAIHHNRARFADIAPLRWNRYGATADTKLIYSSTNSIKLQANSHIGTGLASGTLSGLETDEEGNVIGFDPQKFALGFLGGAGGSVARGFFETFKNPLFVVEQKREGSTKPSVYFYKLIFRPPAKP